MARCFYIKNGPIDYRFSFYIFAIHYYYKRSKMKIVFTINYNTSWGQSLAVVGSIPELGQWEEAIAPDMLFLGDGIWQYEIDIPDHVRNVDYYYLIKTEGQESKREWSRGHSLKLNGCKGCYRLYDTWLNTPADLPFYSSAFTNAVFAHSKSPAENENSREKLTISVFAPRVTKQQYVAFTGNCDGVGNWMPERAVRMSPDEGAVWRVTVDASDLVFPLSYKFILCDKEAPERCVWEEGDDRIMAYPFLTNGGECACFSGLFFRYGNNLMQWKGTGTVIPVFSLRSERSYGVGDLGDLRLMIDWVEKTGQNLIQVLPMNDTRMTQTWLDSYPYSAMSIYALHPMYINLDGMGELMDEERRRHYQLCQHELNAKNEIDYESVVETKLAYCREYVEQEGLSRLMDDEDYQRFYEHNSSWLIPYGAYCYLTGLYKTADFTQWGQYAAYDKPAIKKLSSPQHPAYPIIAFNYYLQYVLDRQFREVTDYARAKGIVLKGDLPIGVNRLSAEVWTEPGYFNLNGQSGAPPDDFSANGQNWLFPTYRWDVMEKDDYAWWRKRFAKMNDYFDCFRIDHILGFFRIWEIPQAYVQGLCGHFNPALPLSVEEIEMTGIRFDEKRFTSPRISHDFLPDLFGEYVDEVLGSYLAQSSSRHFVLKPFCDTQRKIEKLFAGKKDDKARKIMFGLYAIANEVLFLKDPHEEDKYHPRISAFASRLYLELNNDEKRAFDRLYDDFYYHRHNEFWKDQAFRKLIPLVNSTEMLVCGEDLGMIPATVPEVMNKLQLLSLEIERMPKTFGVEFADLTSLPYYSVCTTSTHDMSPVRSWWKEDRPKTQRYYNTVLNRHGEAPYECSGELATQIISNHLSSPAMWVIIPWQDWLATDDELKRQDADAERINVPAQTNYYWRYRMHLTLEELLNADSLNTRINSLIKESNR